MQPAYKPVLRPAFARWLFERGLVPSNVAKQLGVSGEAVRRYCLPISDPKRRRPHAAVLARINLLTDGEITGEDFPAAERADSVQASAQ
jgi:hypothetical protein